MTTFALSTPTLEAPREYRGGVSRTRHLTYEISRTTTEDGGYTAQAVQVGIFHSKDRKQFTATANRVTIKKDVRYGGTSTGFMLFRGVSLMNEPVGRFSAKALDEFTAKVQANFPVMYAASPKVQELFSRETEEN